MSKTTVRFSRKDPQDFFKTLNARVNEYFKEKNIPKTGNWALHLKTAVMFTLFLAPLLFDPQPSIARLGATHRRSDHWDRNGWRGYERDARRKPQCLFV